MANEGIEGVDLVELDIISNERLPAVAADFRSAESLVAENSTTKFERSGPIGNYPLGPSASWNRLAVAVNTALEEGATNLEETAAAIRLFLNNILEDDAEARTRMNQARIEMGEVPTP